MIPDLLRLGIESHQDYMLRLVIFVTAFLFWESDDLGPNIPRSDWLQLG